MGARILPAIALPNNAFLTYLFGQHALKTCGLSPVDRPASVLHTSRPLLKRDISLWGVSLSWEGTVYKRVDAEIKFGLTVQTDLLLMTRWNCSWALSACLVVASCQRQSADSGKQPREAIPPPLTSTLLDGGETFSGNRSHFASPSNPQSVETEFAAALRLAEDDVGAALQSLNSVYEGERLVTARVRLITLLCERNPERSQALLRQLQTQDERNSVSSALGRYWAKLNPARAAALGEQLTKG